MRRKPQNSIVALRPPFVPFVVKFLPSLCSLCLCGNNGSRAAGHTRISLGCFAGHLPRDSYHRLKALPHIFVRSSP